jgi:hypothetical protein
MFIVTKLDQWKIYKNYMNYELLISWFQQLILAGGKSCKISDIKASTKSEFLNFDLGSMSPNPLPRPALTMVCDFTTVKFHTMVLWITTAVSLAAGFQHLKRRHCFHVTILMTRATCFSKHWYKPTQLWYQTLKITKKLSALFLGWLF